MSKTLSAIRSTVRQMLRDEFKAAGTDFAKDELDLHINECLVEISQHRPYEVKETIVSTGSRELDISSIEDLIGEKVEKAEYPTGNDPPDYRDVSVFGSTLRLNIATAPTSGANVYLYCHKVHSLTESASTLSPDLEKVLVDGVVAYAAQAWCAGKMRKDIVPASSKWHQNWADKQYIIYQNSLRGITKPRVWEFYPRG